VAVRRQAFSGADLEPELRRYVDKVTNCAYQITDRDIAALREAGYREVQLFELTVAAALGAGMARLEAGLHVLDGAE
jgi:alkylhydroperoxidase family enzyme